MVKLLQTTTAVKTAEKRRRGRPIKFKKELIIQEGSTDCNRTFFTEPF